MPLHVVCIPGADSCAGTQTVPMCPVGEEETMPTLVQVTFVGYRTPIARGLEDILVSSE